MNGSSTERRESFEIVLVVDGRPARRAALRELLVADGRQLHVAGELQTALELTARWQPDVVLIETALLEASGTILPERVAALAPWATLVACGRPADAVARRALVRRFDLHGIHPDDADPTALCDLVESALASARRARRVLSESELRELIVAKLCHEIRTCLYVIEGYTEILCDAPDVTRRAEVSERIGSTGHFALRLVQGYLDLAKLEPHGEVADAEPVDLEQLVEELRSEAEQQASGRPLRVVVDGAARGAVLDVDGQKLRSVLSHLMANAIERTHRGEVRLDIRMGAAATDFVVGSNEPALGDREKAPAPGDGEAPAELSLAAIRGPGLGLAIAFRLSRLIGASLDADLAAPRGARFRLRVPVRAESRAAAAQGDMPVVPILH